jgi:hypothetical protein
VTGESAVHRVGSQSAVPPDGRQLGRQPAGSSTSRTGASARRGVRSVFADLGAQCHPLGGGKLQTRISAADIAVVHGVAKIRFAGPGRGVSTRSPHGSHTSCMPLQCGTWPGLWSGGSGSSPAPSRGGLAMARDWRCLVGWHDWREVEMPDRDKCAECTRCGKRDWRRLLTRTSGQWRGGDPPPGAN